MSRFKLLVIWIFIIYAVINLAYESPKEKYNKEIIMLNFKTEQLNEKYNSYLESQQ